MREQSTKEAGPCFPAPSTPYIGGIIHQQAVHMCVVVLQVAIMTAML